MNPNPTHTSRPLIFTFLIIFTIFLSLIAAWAYLTRHYMKENDQLRGNISEQQHEVKRWRDEAGRAHALTQSIQAIASQLDADRSAEMEQLREDLKGELGNMKHLLASVKTTAVTHNHYSTIVQDTLLTDSTHGRTFRWADQWSSGWGLLCRDSAMISYTTRVPIRAHLYWKRPHWWKPRVPYLHLVTDNPNTDLDSTKAIVLKPEPKRVLTGRAAAFTGGALASLLILLGVR